MKTDLSARVLLFIAAVLLASGMCQARSTHETIDHVQPRMVKIYGAGGLRGLAAYGTGVLVSKEGHIVTIWSHVLDPDEVVVVLLAVFVETDELAHLALQEARCSSRSCTASTGS